MENYLLFLCICAGITCVGTLLGGIGIFLAGVRIYSVDIAYELSDIAESAFEAAFGVKEAGIALAARLKNPGMCHYVHIVNNTNTSNTSSTKNCDNKCGEGNEDPQESTRANKVVQTRGKSNQQLCPTCNFPLVLQRCKNGSKYWCSRCRCHKDCDTVIVHNYNPETAISK